MAPPPQAVRDALLTGNTDSALKLLADAATEAPQHMDRWNFYRGVAYFDAERWAEAEEAFASISATGKSSAWSNKAMFRRADSLRKQRKFQEAETLYREALSRLRGADRQTELADVIIRLADMLSQSEETSAPLATSPKYNEAIQLYQQALQWKLKDDVRIKTHLQLGRCADATGAHQVAIDAYSAVGEENLPITDPRRWRALEKLGLAFMGSGQNARARRVMQRVLQTDSNELDAAAHPEGAAAFSQCKARAQEIVGDAWSKESNLSLSQSAWRKHLEEYPNSGRRHVILQKLGNQLTQAGRIDEALEIWNTLTVLPESSSGTNRPSESELETARRGAMHSKAQALAMAKRLPEAIATYREYVRKFPDGTHWSQSQSQIIELELQEAKQHLQEERWTEGRQGLAAFVLAHPVDSRVANIQFDIGQSYIDEGTVGKEVHTELVRSGIDHWRQLAASSPDKNVAARALYRCGLVYETILADMESAVRLYKEANQTAAQPHFQDALTRLTKPALSIRSKNVLRTNEQVVVEVSARNHKVLKVQLYDLSLEPYFRKHQSYTGIEELDLDLIAPNQEFEFTVPDYQTYAPLEFSIPLPVEGPGVWAVAVASEKERATTMVVSSDLDFIVKAGPKEVFVYAQNMLEQEPASGVRILFLDANAGNKMVELETDSSGVAVWSPERGGISAAGAQFLAVQGGHVAATHLGIEGLKLSESIGPKSLVYSARPAYRPGETLRWKGIVRGVEAGTWTIPEDREVRITLSMPSGQVFYQEKVKVGAFGTVSGSVKLPLEVDPGEWTIALDEQKSIAQASASIRVEDFRTPRTEVVLETATPVVWRGMTATVTARAQTTYGASIPDAEILWRLPGGRQIISRTDTNGVAAIDVPTEQYLTDASISVSATLSAENVGSTLNLYVASQEFQIQVQAVRPVELTGSSFPVTVSIDFADGSKAPQELVFQALRRISSGNNRWVDELLFERPLAIDETGTVTFPIAIQKGGQIILRAKGTDRFEQDVEGQTALQVSGEDDATKLRLLADRAQVGASESMTVTAVNRTNAGKALLTMETDRVQSHRIVEIREGSTPIELQFEPRYAPNVLVSLAYMNGTEFFEAQTPIQVRQDLRIEILGLEKPLIPGVESQVELRAYDSSGAPVKTEFSIAAIDAALYQLYPGRTPNLDKHFAPPRRNLPALRTQTSCTFAYQGRTEAIAASVLEEEERKKAEAQWLLSKGQLKDELMLAEDPSATPSPLAHGETLRSFEYDARFDQTIGVGGAAGGKFGSRRGGRAPANPNAPRPNTQNQGTPPSPTALWQAHVVSDENGKALVSIPWPQRSLNWRITVHGVGAGNHFGTETAEQVAREDFFVELIAPLSLREGDRARIGANIHMVTPLDGPVSLKLTVGAGESSIVMEKTVEQITGNRMQVWFDELAPITGEANVPILLEAKHASLDETLSANESVAIEPAGLSVVDSGTGVGSGSQEILLSLAGSQRSLEVHITAQLYPDLIDDVLGLRRFPTRCAWTNGNVDLAADLFAALSIKGQLDDVGGHPRYADLNRRIQSLTAQLLDSQKSDGGWAWGLRSGDSDPQTTAFVGLAIANAKRAGIPVPAHALLILEKNIKNAIRQAGPDRLNLRSVLHHTLAAMGRADFPALNQLHRSLSALSVPAQAHLALAFVHADRMALAREIMGRIGAFRVPATVPNGEMWRANPTDPWFGSQVEVTAWVAIALHATGMSEGETRGALTFLTQSRPWKDRKTAGVAIRAISLYSTPPTGKGVDSKLEVTVNDLPAIPVFLKPGTDTSGQILRFDLPSAVDGSKESKVRIRIDPDNDLSYSYTAVLSGQAPATKTKNRQGFMIRDARILADIPRYQGKAIRAGFSVAHVQNQWHNEQLEVPQGEAVRYHIRAQRQNTGDLARDKRIDYLELVVALPAGLQLLETGDPANRKYRRQGNQLIYPIGALRGRYVDTLTLVGTQPGTYNMPPAILRSVYFSELRYVHEGRTVKVTATGETARDTYRITPDERFYMGQALFADTKYAETREMLLPLLDEFGSTMHDPYLGDTAKMLLISSLETAKPEEVVRYFEIVKDRNPEWFVPVDQVLAIGDAYAAIGEHERAMLIFRASLEETFGSDLKLVGILESNNQWLLATRTMDRLVSEYPDFPAVLETELNIAERALSKAPEAAKDPQLVKESLTRTKLTGFGIQRLRKFLAQHSRSVLAPEAALGLVSAFFTLDDFESTAKLADGFAARFEAPDYQDSFRYSAALARWYLGNEDRALNELSKLAETSYPTESGGTRPSSNRDLALYIIAQIHHARQAPDLAKSFYEKVAKLFPDAKSSLQALGQQELQFEKDVVDVRPGEPVSVTLSHRNLDSIELLCFPVDLMTLYLREKDLSRVTEVNLAGISPTLSQTVAITSPSSLRLAEQETQLALVEPGAYLVMARGGDQHASALVLVSDLEVQVSESLDGNVRVQAFDRATGSYQKDVDVRVIGSRESRVHLGKTDPRGLFLADLLKGHATIIARKGRAHYAFHVGELDMAQAQERRRRPAKSEQMGQSGYLQNVLQQNKVNMGSRLQNVEDNIRKERQGVQVQSVK